ncbi:MAG: AAA family ATPase [Candidatus Poribacteria bacterium]|nr:AAA family ATPase [Candidatus Poribacteria bacterium]
MSQARFRGSQPIRHSRAVTYSLKTRCDAEGLRHFEPSGVARLVEYSAELTGDQVKLSTRFADICDLAREASFYAGQNGHSNVTRGDVQKAIDEKIHQANRIEQRRGEMIEVPISA